MSIQFLSRLPIKRFNLKKTPDFASTAYAFPLAGIIIALPMGLIIVLATQTTMPDMVIAFLAVITMTVTTGALHEDGLADMVDGFWGSNEREKKLLIMRESTVGTYGVLVLVITSGLRIVLITTLLQKLSCSIAILLMIAVASLSRAAILIPWILLPPARAPMKEKNQLCKNQFSLSIIFGKPNSSAYLPTTLCSFPAIFILFTASGFLPGLCALLTAILMTQYIVSLSRRHISGCTGDILGATQQISELGLLLGFISVL
ncbi:adenosylcobinamide-GDP ribazoletransferase [Candidatus Endowatersipora endosymbiont of Watersipora subatra]|uniref:adenosylcobinamide-GDP ribazoletransferase n=1 Tax=Candidatus Endowatersipora endosymbiont of Watersipora subatra TaxID=3077946 RepID=UPI00312C8706